ncbi:MAG: response regulator transcription factor [Candidatus Tectomicrobia bacterium]|nr:response regulator transcription factor [Candidatus Tectomicrobia bacterium]
MDAGAFERDLLRLESALGLPGEEGEAAPEAGRPAAAPVILVVDDDPAVRASLREVLGSQYRVQVFSGAEDLRARWSGEGDAAILDIKMPEADGLSVYEDLRLRAPGMPVLFFTAYPGDEEAAERARSLGPAAFLGKGSSLADLRRAVREVTAERATPREEGNHA